MVNKDEPPSSARRLDKGSIYVRSSVGGIRVLLKTNRCKLQLYIFFRAVQGGVAVRKELF